jgi:hypothetical protein
LSNSDGVRFVTENGDSAWAGFYSESEYKVVGVRLADFVDFRRVTYVLRPVEGE